MDWSSVFLEEKMVFDSVMNAFIISELDSQFRLRKVDRHAPCRFVGYSQLKIETEITTAAESMWKTDFQPILC